MELEQIKAYLTENKDSDELKGVISELGWNSNSQELQFDDRVKTFLETNQSARSYLDSLKDSHASKAINTWKEKTMPSLLEQEISKRYPSESPESKKLKELERKIEEAERKALEATLKSRAREIASEKQLPISLVDNFLGQDEETTLKNLETFHQTFNEEVQKAVEAKMASGGRDPNSDKKKDGKTFTSEDVMKMKSSEIQANWDAIKHLF